MADRQGGTGRTNRARTAEQAADQGIAPLVMLPGLMGTAEVFVPQLRALSGVIPTMVAPLLGGDRIETIADHLLTQLPARFSLAGLSMGGIVAMEILRRAPERVSRLCLISTSPLPDTPAQAAEWEPLIIAARSGRLEDVLRGCLPVDCLAPSPQRLDILNTIYEQGCTLGPELFVAQARALQRRTDQQAALRRFKGPALILCGAQDPLTPLKRHEFMAALMPNARLCVIEGAGHLPTLEQPDQVTGAMAEWLAEVAPDQDERPDTSRDIATIAAGAAQPEAPSLPPLTLTNPLKIS
ncbi:alpha/beta fold hydrolase [Phaeobacter gallaeciensis]|uniref:alpha/beta fold hydrolase n=1 Tax=Phaeobacter gallaeciensis TaxID=60890 RepID=UPI000BBC27A4|nr:alpha/beta hydrolase [Phaeobacter gallaeciensis]ATF17878.1 putative hydrolase or acyltransferase (alpha/beta hydrolase superfamily) [Phaeobacter gallaeciensis]ATF21987.1 putative hydrolase or acyltransferase (alpha/beta hydrolase superfamily) [Phaeobacter gallaeciensis]